MNNTASVSDLPLSPSGRALVVTHPSAARATSARPEAAFVAQLIACKARLGIYRTAGRASAAHATASYTAANRLV